MRNWSLILWVSAFVVVGSVGAQEPATSKFKVGVIAPLSGALAEYGLAAQNGIELARAQHPELFSNVQFVYEDSHWDAKTAVSAFNHLRDSEKVSLVYNWGNPTSEAIAPTAERYQLPTVAMTLDPAVARGKKYLIRSTNSAADFATIMANYLRESGFRKIGVVISENTYVKGLLDGLKSAIGSSATVEVIDAYDIQDQDFRTSVTRIASGKYDAIGVFLISGQVSTFYKQRATQAVTTPTFGTDFFESSTEIKLANGGMDGAVYPHLGITDDFRRDYVQKFKNDYQIAYAGNGYDMAITIGKLFNLAPILSPDQIMSRLRDVREQTGIGGRFEFRDTPADGPHFHFPVQLKKIVGEKIETIKES